ncbi:MAG: 3-oxoacyl-[acyl-carrier-protein] synthase III C-terminal domain-containing protein [Acidobacteriota bacterium]
MSHDSIGLQAFAISVPDQVVTNDAWRQQHSNLVDVAEKKLWMWQQKQAEKEARGEASAPNIYSRAKAPYMNDPFCGTKQRRCLRPGERVLDLELDAVDKALKAAELTLDDIDLIISTVFPSQEFGLGGAAFLARALDYKGAAWNLESACASGTIAWQTAKSLIATHQHERVLVVTSCLYSNATPMEDPLSWGVGDATLCAIIGRVPEGEGILSGYNLNTGSTCGAIFYDIDQRENGDPYYRLKTNDAAAKAIKDVTVDYVRKVCQGAVERAGMTLADVDCFAFTTPLAWSAPFFAEVLGVPPERTINTFPLYANIGPAGAGMNLFHAAAWSKIKPGMNVCVYSPGSVASCAAVVMRWGNVALGAMPEGIDEALLDRLLAEGPDPGIEAAPAEVAAAAAATA